MVMLWWKLGLASLAVTVLVLLVALNWRRRGARPRADVVVAHLGRVRSLPRYQTLARRHARLLLAQLVCWLLVALGAGVTMSRLASVDDQSHEMRTRDVMLCLDVSGSMMGIDHDVVQSYLNLVDELREERIGFVVFDSAAVSVFPLTRDRAFVREHLTRIRAALTAGSAGVEGVLTADAGSSLIGDGLASCLGHFDQLDVPRSRTIVLATDNMVSGRPIYSLQQATDLAVKNKIMVFGILPGDQKNAEAAELHEQMKRTRGDTLAVTPGRPSNVDMITRAVQAQTRHALLMLPTNRSFDMVWPGTVLMLLGTAGGLLARGREQR